MIRATRSQAFWNPQQSPSAVAEAARKLTLPEEGSETRREPRWGCIPAAQDIFPHHPRGCPLLKPFQGRRCDVGAGAIPSYMWALRHQGRVLGVRPCLQLGLDEWRVQAHAVLLVSDEQVPRKTPYTDCSHTGKRHAEMQAPD